MNALNTKNLKAKLTFLVIQKRHHLRLFPKDAGPKDRSDNCMPGTVVDTEIMHPTDFNFILQSHAGIQGMSRGTLYNVIHDDSNFTSDDMQSLCYNLCFLAERATRTISVVAPSYRAHIAAFYARMFLDDGGSSDGGSTVHGSSVNGFDAPKLRNVASGIESTMYYM
jgi:eukaryotic translation initiation factor 2C